MAITISGYNTTLKRLLNQDVDFASLKVMLLDATAAFVAADATLNAVAGVGHTKEVYGSGWGQGGIALSGVRADLLDVLDAVFTADNVGVEAGGGDIGPAYFAVIFDDADAGDAPLFFIDFGGAETAADGTFFRFNFDTAGLIRVVYA